MDPLSITVSAIALVGAVEALGKSLRALGKLTTANGELLALLNEIEALKGLLLEIGWAVRDAQGANGLPQSQLSSILELLSHTKSTLLELDQLVHYRLIQPQRHGREVKVARVSWLKERAVVKELQDRLQSDVLNLSVATGMINL